MLISCNSKNNEKKSDMEWRKKCLVRLHFTILNSVEIFIADAAKENIEATIQ